MPVNQEYRAFLGWNILTQKAIGGSTLTYKELAQFVGVHHRVTRFFLALIQDYCMQNELPPLTILVVNATGLPGYGFIAWDLGRFEEGKQKVFQYNWTDIDNPFSSAVQGSVQNQLIDQLVHNPNAANEIYQRVRVRGVSQLIFRQTMLRIYQSSCAFCGLTLDVALEASHIIPWSECEDRDKLNIQNGLLLCSVHHRLFDAGALVVTDEYIIKCNQNFQDFHPTTDFDRLLFSDLDGRQLRLPETEQHRPGLPFLVAHRQQSLENE